MTGAAIVALVAMLGGQQGGAAGGGFGGGGFQGGNINKGFEGEVQSFNHILTPGDRGEWPIGAKKGDVVIIKASSDVFDAALEMVDEKDKVIAQNDDIEDGNQAAQILVRFPADGKYRALVKGYKSAAGGKYTMEIRRLKSLDMDFDKPLQANFPESGSFLLRIPEAKGGTVAFSIFTKSYTQIALFKANGVSVDLSSEVNNGCRQAVFESTKEGDSYIWFRAFSQKTAFKAIASIGKVSPITINNDGVKSILGTGKLAIYELDVKSGDTFDVPQLPSNLRLEQEEIKTTGDNDDGTPALVQLTSEKHNDKYFARKKSKIRFSVSSFEEKDLPYNLVVKGAAASWPAKEKLTDSIGIGQTKLYSFDAKLGEIVKFKGQAQTFDMVFELYDPEGRRVGYNDDDEDLNPSSLIPIGKSGVYTVVISSLGNGGGGTFSLSKEIIPVVALAKDKWITSETKSDSPSRWHIILKKDELYMIRLKSSLFQPQLSVNLPNGDYFPLPAYVQSAKEFILTFRAPVEGEYTLTVRSADGEGKYEIKWIAVGD